MPPIHTQTLPCTSINMVNFSEVNTSSQARLMHITVTDLLPCSSLWRSFLLFFSFVARFFCFRCVAYKLAVNASPPRCRGAQARALRQWPRDRTVGRSLMRGNRPHCDVSSECWSYAGHKSDHRLGCGRLVPRVERSKQGLPLRLVA